eukprot:jgi/Botrbrau1/131/Bobra.0022s0117.1
MRPQVEYPRNPRWSTPAHTQLIWAPGGVPPLTRRCFSPQVAYPWYPRWSAPAHTQLFLRLK